MCLNKRVNLKLLASNVLSIYSCYTNNVVFSRQKTHVVGKIEIKTVIVLKLESFGCNNNNGDFASLQYLRQPVRTYHSTDVKFSKKVSSRRVRKLM